MRMPSLSIPHSILYCFRVDLRSNVRIDDQCTVQVFNSMLVPPVSNVQRIRFTCYVSSTSLCIDNRSKHPRRFDSSIEKRKDTKTESFTSIILKLGLFLTPSSTFSRTMDVTNGQ
ncbi:unnamed protein product [Albugo candida]|uniref:Uncharacterized protein n=1 Tax=Albugo candida TaxID=65357 RepID=A0A024FSS7_9STRA|nr:unnamed protein product [Albugo candida]|eukprot:CCI10055.1 unnamed protein product [Albugo candida]